MRWLSWICLSVALSSAAYAETSEPCERPLDPRDVLIDVRGSDVTVLIANLRDACTIVFTDWLHTGAGQERKWPQSIGIWIETLEGKVFSGMDGGPHHYFAFEDTVGEVGAWRAYDLTRLPAGVVRVKRWTIEKMLHGLDHMRSAYGQGPLPWGTKVLMRVRVDLSVDEAPFAGPDNLQIETPSFLFVLPSTPIK